MSWLNEKINMSIKTKIIVSLMAVLILLSAGLSISNYTKASNSMQDLATSLLENNLQHNMTIASTYLDKYYGNVAYQNGVLTDKNGKDITGDTQMVDALSKDAGVVATVFAKKGDDFVRISTNILNDKGERAVGTMLGKESLAYADVVKGNEYIGQANILNKPYLTAYKPLLDQTGQVIGLLFVGLSQTESAAQIQGYLDQNRNSAMMMVVLALLLSLLLAYLIGKSISKPIVAVAGQMRKLASGDLTVEIEDKTKKRKDEIGLLSTSLAQVVQSIKGLANETNILVMAATDGKLDVRGNASEHQGEYRKVVEGINDVLDAVIGPLNMAAEYVERISQGDIPPKVTEEYNGDFNEIKNNLNHCIDGLGGLVESSAVLKRMAQNDFTKKVEGEYKGVFAEIAKTVNRVRVALLATEKAYENIASGNIMEEIETYRKIGKLSEQDRLIPLYLTALENIQRLVDDAGIMAEAAVAGRLDARVDVTQHQGDYRQVVEGINATLDAIVGPLNMAAEYVERISQGDIPPKVTEEYNGDFNEIKNNLNHCIDGLGGLVESSNVLAYMANNDYAYKVEGKYEGIFAGTAEAVNTVRERLLRVVEVNANIAKGDFAHELKLFKQIGRRC
ncbi:MAG: Cache 3/Cache 2 fusion domain-containing protein, partial [Syntrophomonadaceae bacterium]|nr:Cache 3/Cache 2 fusion domain-containing protein [Syntrophomonadaceae bacterium]